MDILTKERMKRVKILSALLLGLIILFFSLYVIREKENILSGMINIITSPAVLITDFLVVGGIGAAFLNAFLIFLFNFTLVKLLKIEITGIVIASFFTVFGFSFFGKNVFNIIPFYIGGILYSYYDHSDFRDCFVTISFASALAPFVSEIAFAVNSSDTSYINAVVIGAIIGFIVTPLSKKMVNFHEGFNLYNLGFTGGILGAVMTSILKLYDFNIKPQMIISTRFDIILRIVCSSTFLSLITIGFYINKNSFKGYFTLLKDSGLKADYVKKYGYGLTYINMGIMGFVAMFYVYLTNGTLNGPFLAGILTVVGFSAYGKHIYNTVPILIGVYLGRFGTSTTEFTITLSGLFGTALAPITGIYGIGWGIFAGWLHLAVVQSIGIIHGGLNLYNNGFSAGIVAGFLLPIMEAVSNHHQKTKIKFLRHRKKLYDTLNEHIAQHDKEIDEELENDEFND